MVGAHITKFYILQTWLHLLKPLYGSSRATAGSLAKDMGPHWWSANFSIRWQTNPVYRRPCRMSSCSVNKMWAITRGCCGHDGTVTVRCKRSLSLYRLLPAWDKTSLSESRILFLLSTAWTVSIAWHLLPAPPSLPETQIKTYLSSHKNIYVYLCTLFVNF